MTLHDELRAALSRPLNLPLLAGRPTTLTASLGTVDTIAPDTRTLSGMALPIGEVGMTSIGPVEVDPSCVLDFPADLSHVKLVDEHREPPQPIGYLEAQRRTPDGWRMAFHVASTPLGDDAILMASERVRDAFSVELDDLRFNAAGRLVRASVVRVAHVTTPAFASARHDGMAASHNTGRNHNTMLTKAQRARLNELLGITPDDRTDEQTTELSELLELAGGQLPDDGDEGDDDSDEGDDEGDEGDDGAEGEDSSRTRQLAASRRQRTARVPGSLGGGSTRRRRATARPIRELYAAHARVLSGRSRPELEAALSDITNTANIWVGGDEYAGQLWDGLEYVRRFVQNSVPGPLNSYKGTGWRWVVKPAVADYAGDKAAVPSNAPTTEDTEWTAARLAGAHDLDRKFWDFGDEEFIAAYFAAMRESYAMQSDAKALAFQLASANAAGAGGTNLFTAAATAAQAVEDATRATVDYVYVNSADRLGLLGMTESEVPAFLQTFGVTPDKFIAAPGVAAGTVVAGTRQATRFRELSEQPIRVEAINVANGGIDGGVFGYYATELVHEGGIQSVTFAAA